MRGTEVVQREVTIVNKLGLHARAAAKFVTLASRFQADIQLTRGHRQVNGKSIMGVMMLAAGRGTNLVITAEGQDEDQAIVELEQLVKDRFGEEE
jgi:phosphocarrier protein HPr